MKYDSISSMLMLSSTHNSLRSSRLSLFMVPSSPGKSWKVLKFEKSPGKSWNFAEILEKSLNSPGIFLWSNSPEERFLSKHQHFSSFLCVLNVAVHWLTAVIFIWGILDAIMSIYSQHITGWWYSNLQLRA